MGPVAAGFVDNMVIGHLKLSRQSTNALLHFTGAGVQNAMYVDYLELDPNSYSYSDYRDGLVIDPNLTIYFATQCQPAQAGAGLQQPPGVGPEFCRPQQHRGCSLF